MVTSFFDGLRGCLEADFDFGFDFSMRETKEECFMRRLSALVVRNEESETEVDDFSGREDAEVVDLRLVGRTGAWE